MGYLEKIELSDSGVTVTPFADVSFADKVELELALATDSKAFQNVCWNCFTPIGSGNSCYSHKDLKGSIYNG